MRLNSAGRDIRLLCSFTEGDVSSAVSEIGGSLRKAWYYCCGVSYYCLVLLLNYYCGVSYSLSLFTTFTTFDSINSRLESIIPLVSVSIDALRWALLLVS
jgi:hypothetical protein